MPVLKNNFGFGFFPGTAAPAIDPDAAAYIARFGSAPSAGRQTIISDYFAGLKTDGIYTKIDEFWLIANTTGGGNNGFLGGKNVANITQPNQGTMTADLGWTGDGVDDYLNTNANPTTINGQFQNASASFGVYLNSGPNTSAAIEAMGVFDGTGPCDLIPNISNLVSFVINGGGSVNATANNLRQKWSSASRQATNSRQTYRDDGAGALVQIANNTTNSGGTGRPNASFFLAARNNGSGSPSDGFSTNRFAFAFLGGGLTSTEMTALFTRTQTYLTALGAN